MNIEKEREAFEAWVADRKVVTKYGAKIKWQPTGQCYLDYRINDRWLAWQARAAMSAEAGPVAVTTGYYGGHPTVRPTNPAAVLPQGMALYAAPQPQPAAVPDIDAMVSSFLSWPLPENVCADPCASMPGYPHRSGTSLMNAEQAKAMLLHVLAAAPAPAGWVPVTERLPSSRVPVLARYTNDYGNGRTIRAWWLAKFQQESEDIYNFDADYDEESDTYYDPEGWYELIDNWGDYSSVAVTEGAITHWMPMPLPPVPEVKP